MLPIYTHCSFWFVWNEPEDDAMIGFRPHKVETRVLLPSRNDEAGTENNIFISVACVN